MPAVLVEVAFISNAEEEKKLKEPGVPAGGRRRRRARRRPVLRQAACPSPSARRRRAPPAMSRRAAAILLAVLAAAVAALLFVNRSGLPRFARRGPRPFLRVAPAAPAVPVTAAPGRDAGARVETIRITLFFPDQNGAAPASRGAGHSEARGRRRLPEDALRRAAEGPHPRRPDRRRAGEDAAAQRVPAPRGPGRARPGRGRRPRVRLGRGAGDRGLPRRHDAAERGGDVPCENPGQRRARRNPGRPRGSDTTAALHPQRHRAAGIGNARRADRDGDGDGHTDDRPDGAAGDTDRRAARPPTRAVRP